MKPRLSIILSLFILFSGCSSSLRKQRKQYEKATSGVTYKTYKTASQLALAGSMAVYNDQQPDSLQIRTPYAHLFLGYFWSVSGKSSLAFAEANIVEEKSNQSNDSHMKYLGQSLRAITQYQAGWYLLAAEESAKARQSVSIGQVSRRKYEAAVIHLLLGSIYIKEKDFENARFFWGAFATETGIGWPYQICEAAAAFQGGNVQLGLQKVKSIAQDPAVPKPIRDQLTLELEKVEAHAGSSIDSSLFWPSIVGTIIWQELRNSSLQSLNKFAKTLEDVGSKL